VLDGPSLEYGVLTQINQEAELRVTGQNSNCQWLKVIAPLQIDGWIFYDGRSVSLQIPCESIPEGTFRPLTGIVKPPIRSGAGQLSIDNGTNSDGVVAIVDTNNPGEAIAAAYIRSGEKYLLDGIPDGTYYVFVASGSEWSGATNSFTVDRRAERFENIAEYTTSSRQFTILEITLHPVLGGSGRTDVIPPDEFPVIK